MKLGSLLLLFIFTVPAVNAQQGEIVIHKDAKIDAFLDFYADHVNSFEEAPGYRIQILGGTSRDEAYKVRGKFKYQYSQYQTYLTYNSPYFKVRVGDFIERLDAYRFLQQIKPKFSGAFMVEEVVQLQ